VSDYRLVVVTELLLPKRVWWAGESLPGGAGGGYSL